jgi:hypothetical protein
MNSLDSNQLQPEKEQPNESNGSKAHTVQPPQTSPILPTRTRIQNWLHSQGLPGPFTLAAIILASFLIFPAYRGLVSGQTIRRLGAQVSELQQALEAARDRSNSLEMELSQRDLQPAQRDQPQGEIQSGMFVSPLLSLEPRQSKMPDLIRISFAHSNQAVLIFHPPTPQVEKMELRVFQRHHVVWNQILAYSAGSAASPNLVTLILSASVLSPGNYQLELSGISSQQRGILAQFDLTVEN